MPFHWGSALASATSGWFLLFGWSSCYFGVKHFHELEKQKSNLFASQSLLREAQLQALRYQLQPHFLYNTLNAISTLVLQGKSRQATQMIARLGDLLRETLAAPQTHLVSLAEELITTRLYIAIEQMRFESRLVFAEEISDDVLSARVPRFLLQPLVENAVRHGIARLSSGGTLLLKVNRRADTLVVEIVNDCPALPVVVDGRKGLGLVNTQARLEHLYGENQSITVVPDFTIGKFDVTVRVPFTTEEMTAIPSEDSAA
jgi:LytS/YehU family sensor histidine kinase